MRRDIAGHDCLFSEAGAIPEELKQVAMRACNNAFWLGCSKWLEAQASKSKPGGSQISVELPREAGQHEGLRAVAQASNHKQRLRGVAISLVVHATLQGKIDTTTLKEWHDQLPRFVADIKAFLLRAKDERFSPSRSCDRERSRGQERVRRRRRDTLRRRCSNEREEA